MHYYESKFLEICTWHSLFSMGDTVIVGVSGGSDSMALLYLMHGMINQLNLKLVAAHVNHGLRPAEARRERDLVQEHADRLEVCFETTCLNVQEKSQQEKLSIEDAARQLRYEYFYLLASKYGASKIAVAHTADDQAEEVLLRMIRGTGRKGLSGMCRVRDNKIIRPLLGEYKSQLLEYISEKEIPFLEDSSNNERVYLRNKVRLDLIPFLTDHFNPDIKKTLCQTAEIIQSEEVLLEAMGQDAYQEIVAESVCDNLPKIIIDLVAFQAQPVAIGRRVIEKVFWHMQAQPSFRKINAILDLSQNIKDGEQHFSQGLRVEKRGSQLQFYYPKGKVALRGRLSSSSDKTQDFLVPGPGSYDLYSFGIRVCFELINQDAPVQIGKEEGVELIDFEKLSFPLLIRSRNAGDRFHPLGAIGSKKVGNFLSDLKIAQEKRTLVPILLKDDMIIALLGLRIDHSFRVTETSQQVLKITIEQLS